MKGYIIKLSSELSFTLLSRKKIIFNKSARKLLIIVMRQSFLKVFFTYESFLAGFSEETQNVGLDYKDPSNRIVSLIKKIKTYPMYLTFLE